MRYVSTRGAAPALGFTDVLLAGLARDGGLYVPERWPVFGAADWASLAGVAYADLAARILAPFMIGDRAADDPLPEILRDAYAGFSSPAVTPLVQIGPNDWILELFHGPTFAFKDLAMQVLGRLMDRALTARDQRVTIVGATSGDTGSAAIEAFAGRERADIFILHPKGRVSDIQRKQMTTVDASNVFNIALEGTFDDAQALVKAMFNDLPFRDGLALAGVNSINWARVMAQIPYYAAAALALGGPARPVAFAVPTGNFGDILAGFCAKRMGLPVAGLTIATNVNDILVRCLATGRYQCETVTPTQSPSMDIQVSSNFERLIFEATGRDGGVVRGLLDGLAQSGAFELPDAALARIRAEFTAVRVDEATTTDTIRAVYKDTGLVIDPHTAVGVAAARARKGAADVPMVALATAHPAKFAPAVTRAIGRAPELPPKLAALADLPERMTVLPNDLATVQRFIRERSRVRS